MIPTPVLMIALVVLLVAIIYLAARIASLGKQLDKLTQAFVGERQRISQLVRSMNDDGIDDEFDMPLSAPARPQGAPASMRPAGSSGQPASAPRPNPSRVGMAPIGGAGGSVRPVGVGGAGGLGGSPAGQARQGQRNAYHEEREKRGKRGLGRRNKPVIPFGVDRSNERQSSRAAAAIINDAPALSMDLSEPAQILRQREMGARPQAASVAAPSGMQQPGQRPMPDRPRDQRDWRDQQQAVQQHAPQMRSVGGSSGQAQGQSHLRQPQEPLRMSDQGRDLQRGMRDEATMAAQRDPRQADPSRGEQPRFREGGMQQPRQARDQHYPLQQSAARSDFRSELRPDARSDMRQDMRPNMRQEPRRDMRQESCQDSRQDSRQEQRRPIEEDPRVAREKAAISAAWAAEEERRTREKQARQAAQAKRAERQSQVRRPESTVQNRMRQAQPGRDRGAGMRRQPSASDTIQF